MAGGRDLLTIVNDFCRDRRSNYSVNVHTQRFLRVTFTLEQARTISGLVETGDFGYESELYDITQDVVSYQRTTTDTELTPYYFFMNLPPASTFGILILQRRGQYGVTTTLMRDFRKYLEAQYPQAVVEFKPLVHEQFLTRLFQDGDLKKIRLIRHEIPSDYATAFGAGGPIGHLGHLEVTLSAGRGLNFPGKDRILEVLGKQRTVDQLVELPQIDYDNVKVEMELGGRRRTIDLSDVMKLRANFDITDEVETGSNGHPIFSSIDEIARDLNQELTTFMGI